MPTYEYRCNACESEFEVEKRMSDPVQATCPACGSDQTQRLISHSSFVLKGSGWYLTDYARKNGKSDPGDNGGKHGKPAGDGHKDGAPEPASSTPASAAESTTPSSPAAAPSAATSGSSSASGSAGAASTTSPSS